MGERQIFQPLTTEDKVTVLLYRAGIALATVLMAGLAFLLATASPVAGAESTGRSAALLLYGLHAAVGMSVFFIHLYIGKFKRFLINLYVLSLAALGLLLFLGSGSPAAALDQYRYSPLLLLPLSGCLGFVTAKEAFCFKLLEGYLLAMLMPLYLLLVSAGGLPGRSAVYGLVLIAVMLAVFSARKLVMPLAYDIGDKSAYQ